MDMRKYVLKQTGIVALGELVGIVAMWGVFALLGAFDLSVVWGGLVGAAVATGNFFALAIGVNIAADKAEKQDVKGGQAAVKSSYVLRLLVMALVLIAFAKSGICNVIALAVPLLFVRVTLTVTEFFKRKPGEKAE